MLDAPVRTSGTDAFLLDLLGDGFALVVSGRRVAQADRRALASRGVRVLVQGVEFDDPSGLVAARLDAVDAPAVYLVRPDQYVAARLRGINREAVFNALETASGAGAHVDA